MVDSPDTAAAWVRHHLRILHISDLHVRGPHETDRARRNRVLGERWQDNLRELRVNGPFDLVVFTGDVAHSGADVEYDEVVEHRRDDGTVTRWLDDTLSAVGCTRAQLYVVPGNHDIDRSVHPDAWRAVRDAWSGGAENDAAFARWIARDLAPPRGMDPALRGQLLARQAAYRAWLTRLGRPELLPDPRRSHLGFQATLGARLPFPVHIIGLDSAWLAGDDHDARRVRLTDDQILGLCTDGDGEPLRGLRIALLHHPLGELADGERARRLLREYGVALLLSGHLHEPEARAISTPDGRLLDIATGCLYQHDRFPNAMTALTLGLTDTGALQEIDLRFRGWSDQAGWHDHNGLYAGTSNGRLRWSVGASAAVASTPAAPTAPSSARAARTPEAAEPGQKHVILFLAANPGETSRLALDEECAAIERELAMTAARDDFQFTSKWAVSVDELLRHLNALQPAIIHFSGHGADSADLRVLDAAPGGIHLQGEGHERQLVTARALTQIIRSATPSTRVVVLNACFTDGVADELRRAVDCVIGMRGAIGDGPARSFAVGFYRALGHRRSVGNAVAQAIAELAALGLSDEHVPVCRSRDGTSPDEIVLPAVHPGRS